MSLCCPIYYLFLFEKKNNSIIIGNSWFPFIFFIIFLICVTFTFLVCCSRLFHIIFFRSHLREIRDRSVLRLFESNEVTAPQVLPGGPGVPQPLPQSGGHWDQDQVKKKTIHFGLKKKKNDFCYFFCHFRATLVSRNSIQNINISTYIRTK